MWLPFLCEKSGAIALALPGLTAGRPAAVFNKCTVLLLSTVVLNRRDWPKKMTSEILACPKL